MKRDPNCSWRGGGPGISSERPPNTSGAQGHERLSGAGIGIADPVLRTSASLSAYRRRALECLHAERRRWHSHEYALMDVPLRQRKGAFSLLGGEAAVRDSGAFGASPGSGGRKGAAR